MDRSLDFSGEGKVAVDFGYTTVHVSEYKPERIINHFRELPDAVASLPGFAGL